MLAMPCYDSPSAASAFALARSRQALTDAGVQSALLILQGNCHVDDARNAIVRDFLESDCTDLVFLDADVDWEPKALVQLCSRDLDVVGGVYPFRRDGGEQMPVRLKDVKTPDADGLLEVEGLPTGFIKIKRHVLERMAALAPKYFDKVYETALVFDRPTPGPDKTRWGGDIDFCNRWRAMGGRLFADAELRLGHTGQAVVRDSLAAHLRRVRGMSLVHVAQRLRDGTENEGDYNEVFKAAGNNFAADAGVLALVVGIARKCRGPIIEAGSGLSSVLMGAVTDQKIYSLEHEPRYADQTLAWAEKIVAENVGLCCAPLKDYWYDLSQFPELPRKFAFGFCDGPPRLYGTRMKFFEVLGPRCEVIAVDDFNSDNNYARLVHEWAAANGRTVTVLGRAAMICKEGQMQKAEAA
jgi:predicted O-methyltransferase YrrM